MEQYFVGAIEWVSDNRFWLGPIALTVTMGLMVWVGMSLGKDIRDDLKEYRK